MVRLRPKNFIWPSWPLGLLIVCCVYGLMALATPLLIYSGPAGDFRTAGPCAILRFIHPFRCSWCLWHLTAVGSRMSAFALFLLWVVVGDWRLVLLMTLITALLIGAALAGDRPTWARGGSRFESL